MDFGIWYGIVRHGGVYELSCYHCSPSLLSLSMLRAGVNSFPYLQNEVNLVLIYCMDMVYVDLWSGDLRRFENGNVE